MTSTGGATQAPSVGNQSLQGSPDKIRKPDRVIEADTSSIGQCSDSMDLDQMNDNLPDFLEDNVSLEVNLGDGSCRASDVSSLSFQNVTLDDHDDIACLDQVAETGTSVQESEDSCDSCPNDDDTDLDQAGPHFSTESLEAKLKHKAPLFAIGTKSPTPHHQSLGAPQADGAAQSEATSIDSLSAVVATSNRSCDLTSHMADQDQSQASGVETSTDHDQESQYDNIDAGQDGEGPMDEDVTDIDGLGNGVSEEAKEAIDALITNALELMDNDNTSVGSSAPPSVQWESPTHYAQFRPGYQKDSPAKRNSLEIRNNIPDAQQAKDYQELSLNEIAKLQAMTNLRKHSPGLARRLPVGTESVSSREAESSNSEHEMTPVGDKALPAAISPSDRPLQNGDAMSIASSGPTQGRSRESSPEKKTQIINRDIENEYAYVKTARIQHGDSYVGMRLAYSSSQDSLKQNSLRGIPSSDDDHGMSSREGSPDKMIKPLQDRMYTLNSMGMVVNEENFTEISLGSIEPSQMDEKKKFTLSPEATECDSAEVESIMSDDGQSPGCMPYVEDGLSSSQGSDVEDAGTLDTNQPAEILKRRRRMEVESGLTSKTAMDTDSAGSSQKSTPSRNRDRVNKEALDLALKDIQTAIQRSKAATLKSPYQEDDPPVVEPVWIMRSDRDTLQQQPHNEEVQRVIREMQEMEREEDRRRLQEEDDSMSHEVDEEKLPRQQFGRSADKAGQASKGLESDDEMTGHARKAGQERTRWNKGKTYSAVTDQADDPTVQSAYSSPHFPSLKYNRYASEYKSPLERTPMYKSSSMSNSDLMGARTASHNGNQGMNSHPHSNGAPRSRSETDVSKHIIPDGRGSEGGSDDDMHERPCAYIRTTHEPDYDTDEETAELLENHESNNTKVDIPELTKPPVNRSAEAAKRRTRAREGEQQESLTLRDPDDDTVLIEGVLFRARYLGSTQLISEGQPSKPMRMMQAQEAVGRIKAPEGENQPSTEVDLFVSTEKIMVLNTDLQEVMMDHTLRTISYIADIGDIIVVMARRRLITSPGDEILRRKKQSKILCHVFETDEAQLIAQSIGQAFQVAYMEFLKANGIDDPGLMKEMDYQDVLAQQEIFGEELSLFSNKEKQKEVITPKLKGEPLGVVIVESGWGSMVPTVVLANMNPTGAAARCGQLNIGDQIISVNGVSLVGLPLSTCQNYIKAVKNQTVVKLTVVSCPPVVEVLIKRPDVKYQLGFSVQNGVICSLLRGGIAERGGVRVGHRIIEINGSSVVAVQHEKIVSMLATSVGEINMKTMPTSIFRLLTGQDTPHYI